MIQIVCMTIANKAGIGIMSVAMCHRLP